MNMNSTPKPETQAIERSTIQPHGVSQICKPIVASIGIVALAAITVACSPEPDKRAETPPPPCPQCESKPLSKSAEDELKVGTAPPVVVFAVDAAGKIQAFRGANAKAFQPEFPLATEKVLALEGISLVILNPKVCWETTDGDKECVTY